MDFHPPRRGRHRAQGVLDAKRDPRRPVTAVAIERNSAPDNLPQRGRARPEEASSTSSRSCLPVRARTTPPLQYAVPISTVILF